MKKVKIINGQIITPYRIIKNGTLLIDDGKITLISETDVSTADYELIDAKGNYVSPGFIDIHIHGGGGHDFMDGTEEAYLKIAEIHARYGTTAMAPTTLTCAQEDLFKAIDLYRSADAKNTNGAQFIGMHLEGPYFALSQSGAQDPRYIRNPDAEEYKAVIAYGGDVIKRWSVAPELPGAVEMGQYLRAHGIIAAIAHTDAIHEEVVVAAENGYNLATHLYSAMSGVTRRNTYRFAGVIESAFLMDDMDVEIITDGIHLPAPLLKLVYKIKGSDRTALITDAMRGAGMPEGESVLGNKDTGLKVIIENGVAIMADRSSFAGSVATADRLIRTMVQMADVSLIEAVRMLTKTPAKIMGIVDTKGTLAAGKDADVLIFDDHINIKMTMVNGKIIYTATDFTYLTAIKMKEFLKDKLTVKVFETRKLMGEAVAIAVSERINAFLEKQPEVNIIFGAAPSQNEFFASLLTQQVDWSRVNAFHMDEYLGLPSDAPQGFGNFIKERLFDLAPFRSVNYINGDGVDYIAECARYSALLREFPTDIVCLGIGENTHLAFNDPHVADIDDPYFVKRVDLDHACRNQQVNDGCFAQIDQVPTHALTLTLPALLKAPYAFCTVPSEKKASAIFHTLNEEISDNFPSTLLRNHDHAVLYLDEQSSSKVNALLPK